MKFRFTLTHQVEGTIEISAPDGCQESILRLQRDDNFHSLIETLDGSFIFYGKKNERINGGIDFLLLCERKHGYDTEIVFKIEIDHDYRGFNVLYYGTFKFIQLIQRPDNTLQLPVIRDGFWNKFITRYDSNVNIQSHEDLDGNPVDFYEGDVIELFSQPIQKITSYKGHSGDFDTITPQPIAATTTNIVLSGIQTIDNVSGFIGMSVGVKDQVDQKLNGVYNMQEGAWNRRSDANTTEQLNKAIFSVQQGTVNAGKAFRQMTLNPVIGTSNIVFEEYDYVRHHEYNITVIGDYRFFASPLFETDQSDINNSYKIPFYPLTNIDEVQPAIEITTNESGRILLSGSIGIYFKQVRLFPSSFADINVALRIKINDVITTLDEEYYPNTIEVDRVLNTYDYEFFVNPSDRIVLYLDINLRDDNVLLYFLGGVYNTDISFSFKSFSPNTRVPIFTTHDVLGYTLDRIVGGSNNMISSYFGSPFTKYESYPLFGCGARMLQSRGLQIRGYDLYSKPFFTNFKQQWDALNAIVPLSLSYVEGQDQIVIEEREFQYNENPSVYLSGWILTRSYDIEKSYKQIKIGYKVWASDNVSGLDDPQTKRTFSSQLNRSGTDLILESDFIAASMAIETTRRTNIEMSSDWKYDENIFLISGSDHPIIVNGEPKYEPELYENFSTVINLRYFENRYNIRFSASRNLKRHNKFLSSGMFQYPEAFWMFTSGEGNFDMVSQLNSECGDGGYIDEKGNQNVDIPVFTNALYEFEDQPLSWIDYLTIRERRHQAIAVSQTNEGHGIFYIKVLDYDINKGTASGSLIAKEFYDLIPIVSDMPDRDCIPSDDTFRAILQENTGLIITEDGDYYLQY